MSKKKLVDGNNINVTHSYSSFMSNVMARKKDNTISCTITTHRFYKALYGIGAIINLIPYVVYQNIRLGAPIPTTMRLLMEDHSIIKPVGVLYDVLVKVDTLILLMDYVLLDCEIVYRIHIILASKFLETIRVFVDMECGEMIFQVHYDGV